jgi:hypothetical protein
MEGLGSILIVFAILLVVTITAVSFEPANPLEAWLKLSERYATERRPSTVQFPGQRLMFGVGKKRVKSPHDLARFDVTIDDFGLWIVFKNANSDNLATALKVPGTHVRFELHHGQQYLFQVYAEPPVRLAVRGELGETLMQRSQGADTAA